MTRQLWTREELILAFNLYLKIPFGKMHKHTKEVIELANLIGRTPSSIAMRLGNFASLDPYHQERGVGGLKGGMNQVKPIWDAFYKNQEELVFISEKLLAELEKTSVEVKYQSVLNDLDNFEGETVIREVKTRVNQSIFRTIVMNNYTNKCCITGLSVPKLLVASHIVPWSKDSKNRLNPSNGICLNAIHDKAFDTGLLTITTDYKIKLSNSIGDFEKDESVKKFFKDYENSPIAMPERYLPNKDFLAYHHENVFIK